MPTAPSTKTPTAIFQKRVFEKWAIP